MHVSTKIRFVTITQLVINEIQLTCINKNLHIHKVSHSLIMENEDTLQYDYIRCINL